ncbi:MAG TPA: GMC family oxidoreductase [Anaerolineae bacterium]|nr:GMC family oxidoreductase [Anaerolineae bacterium]
MTDKVYDVVIVGAGISGAIVAKTLSQAGHSVLILEAGLDAGLALEGEAAYDAYQAYLNTYYLQLAKVPNAAYPNLPTAPSPNVLDVNPISGTTPNTNGYFVQAGPLPFPSDYARVPGGTTLHWLGTCLRMLPNDFRLKTQYGVGVDWPISYEELRPYYEMAEREIGVSAEVEEQRYPHMGKDFFGKDYVFPMHKLPPSYLDQQIHKGVRGMTVSAGEQEIEVYVTTTPQGRNSTPNRRYRRSAPHWDAASHTLRLEPSDNSYEPVGALWDPYTGQRCEGNASCVPICPVQAKYNALKTLKSSLRANVDLIAQAVASKVELDPASGRVTGIAYKRYHNPDSPEHTVGVARGKVYVLAAHSVENAKLLLASGIANTSDQVGRNLMDHAVLLTWGLMPQPVYSFRGPGSTSNIPVFRDGDFRAHHAAFIVPIDNWGWGWPTGAPDTDLDRAVNRLNLFGKALRKHIEATVTRQVLLHFECEQLPEPSNRITLDPQYVDRLGNYRPVIHYDVSDYIRAAFAAAKRISDQMFARIGVQDYTQYDPTDADYVTYHGAGYSFRGAGHLVGTHRMGFSPHDSVVNREQRTWDHPNLFLVGCGNMPTLGTSNPTLTMAALTFWAAENIIKDLQ